MQTTENDITEKLSIFRENKNLSKLLRRVMVIGRNVFGNPTAYDKKSKRHSLYAELQGIASSVFSEIQSQIPCAKCSHCCHQAVTINEYEAYVIGVYIKAKPQNVERTISLDKSEEDVRKWSGIPCPFLKDGECSIYWCRPLSCRLHHSLANTPDRCDIVNHPGETVPSLDFRPFYNIAAHLMVQECHGDIREYFPTEVFKQCAD